MIPSSAAWGIMQQRSARWAEVRQNEKGSKKPEGVLGIHPSFLLSE
ncbi:hypothetical protein [Deinococcus roseus]|nr:hypothetical protein [Deinococcus roseus]